MGRRWTRGRRKGLERVSESEKETREGRGMGKGMKEKR